MNKKYRKGYLIERRVRKYLEKKGYKVFRLAGSKPADLIAMKNNQIYIIECKVEERIRKNAREKIIALTEGTSAKPLIALRKNRKIIFIDPIKNSELTSEI